MKILVIGSVNKDIVFDVDHIVRDGETISSSKQSVYLGGKGLNQTIALSNVFDDVSFYCNVNKFDNELIKELCNFRFKTDFIQEVDELTGSAFIQVNQVGENAIVISKNANGCIDLLKVKSVLDMFERGDYVVLQNEINDLAKIIDMCFKRGLRVVLNPSPIDDSISMELLSKVEMLIANKEEFQNITNGDNLEECIELFRDGNKHTKLVVTLGGKGAIYHDNKTIRVAAIETDVVDTTCAGDTFLGYFVGSIMNDLNVELSLKIASKAASICVGVKGASVSIPQYEDVIK